MPKRDEIFYTDLSAGFSSGFLPLTLLKESQKEGKVWRVRIIKSGWSKNGVFYSPTTLKESQKLFEGVNVNAFQFRDHYFDHLPDSAADLVKQGFAMNLAGWLDKVKFEKVNGVDSLTGDYHVTNGFIRSTLKTAWEAGKKDLLGFSIDAKGKIIPGIAEGKSGKIAEKIKHVNSVDIVTLPAAGGELMRLVASQGGSEMNENIKKLIGMVRENPEILGLKEGETVEGKSDDEVLELLTSVMGAKKTQEAEETEEEKKKKKEEEEKKKAQESEEEKEKVAKEAEEQKAKEAAEVKANFEKAVKEGAISPEALGKVAELIKAGKADEALKMIQSLMTPAQESTEDPPADPPENVSEAMKKKMEEVDKIIEIGKVRESMHILTDTLNSDKVLPEVVKEKIKNQFKDKVFEEDDLKESIKLEKEVLSKLSESGEVKGMGHQHITTGLTPVDRERIAMDKLLGVIPDDNEKDDFKKVPEFEGLKEAYVFYTGDRNVRGEINQSMREAVSSDFPQALGTSMERRLLQEYSRVAITEAWKKFAVIDKPTNYKTQDLIRIGGLTDLPVVAEDGVYTEFASPSEEKASYNIEKRGKIFKVTREMIKDDDLRMLRKIPVKMGQAAARTLAKFVFDLVLNVSGGVINAGTIYDSVALYHANHGANLTSLALNTDTLDAAITAMANQAEPDSAETLDIQAAFLLVPYELRATAKILIGSEKRPIVATAGSKTGTDESINPNFEAVEPIIIPNGYLRSDQNNWYLIGDKKDAEGAVIGFLDGRENPEVLLQDNPAVDTVFTHDRIKYKVRHEYSGVIADYRPFYAGIEAGLS